MLNYLVIQRFYQHCRFNMAYQIIGNTILKLLTDIWMKVIETHLTCNVPDRCLKRFFRKFVESIETFISGSEFFQIELWDVMAFLGIRLLTRHSSSFILMTALVKTI